MSNINDSQNISGNNNITTKGNNNTFVKGDNNQINSGVNAEQMTATEVVEMLAYLQQQIQNLTALPEAEQQKSVKRLEAAKVDRNLNPTKNLLLKVLNESTKP